MVRVANLTPVPGANDLIRGLVNLHGEILVVADVRKALGLDRPGIADLSRVIVLGAERAELGLLVDATHELRSLGRTELHEPAGEHGGGDPRHVLGVTRDALVVLDGKGLLQDRRLYIDAGEDGAAPETTTGART